MAENLNKPLNLELRRRAAYLTLSEFLTGDMLVEAMWMIEERDQSADKLTFLGFVSVTAEIFDIDAQIISRLIIKLNNNLSSPKDKLPPDPLPEMLKFRGISPQQASRSKVSDSFIRLP
jgi:hypothetical protein